MRTHRIAFGLIVAVTLARTFAYAQAPATPIGTADMVGLPDWASREYFEVSPTASLATTTPEDRSAMIRAMLSDRFKLQAHRKRREVQSFDPDAPLPCLFVGTPNGARGELTLDNLAAMLRRPAGRPVGVHGGARATRAEARVVAH